MDSWERQASAHRRKNNRTLFQKEPRLRDLEKKLLKVGGEGVLLGPEILIQPMLERGSLMAPRKLVYKRGAPSRCHWNAVALYLRDPVRYRVVTGYALTGDLWRSHSWCMRGADLIETTCKFDKYWGLVMDDGEATLHAIACFSDFFGFKDVADDMYASFKRLVDAQRAKQEADAVFEKARTDVSRLLLPFAERI